MKIFLLGFVFFTNAYAVDVISMPSPELQKTIFKAIRSEMIRLDGEGLIARKARPLNFLQTTDNLLNESIQEKNVQDFYSLFKRLDGAYTNLHSKLVFNPELEQSVDIPLYKTTKIGSIAEVVPGTETKLFVNYIEDEDLKTLIEAGDEIVGINGRSIGSWLDENFLFCKLPLKGQCDNNFEVNLLSLNLSWKGTKLIYSVNHHGNIIDIEVKFYNPESSIAGSDRKLCDYKADKKYPNFKLVYKGQYNCLFENIDDPSIALMRISSFLYRSNDDPANRFKSVDEEVDAFYPFWKQNAGKYKELIIDVLSNGGGNAPIPYYKILVHGLFQEQYVEFKKTKEFEDARLRSAMLWGNTAQELSYQKLLSSGEWSKLAYGSFTRPIPMFCADDSRPCEETFFEPYEHNFRGNVRIMVNEWCVSSCDGFVWAMDNLLKAKLYGQPQAADSAYARLRIDAIWDVNEKNGFKVVINPERGEFDPNFIIGQTIAVSRATDAQGNIFNGNPLSLEKIIPYRFNEYYPKKVLQAVMEDLKGR
jgi:hypothetical protein